MSFYTWKHEKKNKWNSNNFMDKLAAVTFAEWRNFSIKVKGVHSGTPCCTINDAQELGFIESTSAPSRTKVFLPEKYYNSVTEWIAGPKLLTLASSNKVRISGILLWFEFLTSSFGSKKYLD